MAACARLPISMIGLGLVNGNERFSSNVRNWAKADVRECRVLVESGRSPECRVVVINGRSEQTKLCSAGASGSPPNGNRSDEPVDHQVKADA
jgi:hypothetical protein